MKIEYIDRKTGEKRIEQVYGKRFLTLLYGDGFFLRVLSRLLLPIFAHLPICSQLYGLLQKRPASAKRIAPFIKKFGVDETEFQEKSFASFNDFFIRKLKPEKRPIQKGEDLFVAPADGRYFVYPEFNQFVVKGQAFSLPAFVGNIALANRYKEGSMAIIRLCPTDYHRFHFPCEGTPSKAVLVNGPLYSVNPIALRRRLAILAENKRMITEIETKRFGTLLYIEIGATNVGSIRQTYPPDQFVCKGEEKGYFEFGGSCIVLFFEKDQIVFDRDLIENTKQGLETLIHFGDSIGKK